MGCEAVMWARFRQWSFNNPLTVVLVSHPLLARLAVLLVAALISVLILFLFRSSFLTFEEQVGSVAWRLNPDTETEERISIIAIDEESIEQLGPWPWPRATMAQLANALNAAGVQLQLYDILFSEAREDDDRFLAALQAAPAVIPQILDLRDDQNRRSGLLTHPLTRLGCADNTSLNTANSFLANAPYFASVPKGLITALLEADGAVRKAPAVICVDGLAYPALSVSGLLVATGAENWDASLQEGSGFMAPAQKLQLDAYPGFNLPLDAAGNMRVSFRKDPAAYRAFSAVDIINGEIDPELLANTWVLIGSTAFGLNNSDIVPTPYGSAPGVQIHARILGSMLDNNIPYTPTTAPVLLVLLSILFGAMLYLLSSKQEKAAGYSLAACMLLFPALAILLHVQLLNSANIWLGWLAPSLYSIMAAGLLVLHEYARVRLERGRVLNNLSSYLPAAVAKEIAYSLPSSSISAQRQNVTLLSADLRNFSAYGESRPPEESAALLHFFFVRATEIVEEHHGQVHEFKGDGLIALWNGSDEEAARLALEAAQAMQHSIQEVLPQTPPAGLEPLALGIGIEQGPVLVGSIGPAHRRTHTLLGETVTIVLRIQDMTMDLAQPILVGECAARQLSGNNLQSQGSYLLNGLQTPHTLFAPAQKSGAATKNQGDAPSLKLLHGGRQ